MLVWTSISVERFQPQQLQKVYADTKYYHGAQRNRCTTKFVTTCKHKYLIMHIFAPRTWGLIQATNHCNKYEVDKPTSTDQAFGFDI
jgi:hypothetical protein